MGQLHEHMRRIIDAADEVTRAGLLERMVESYEVILERTRAENTELKAMAAKHTPLMELMSQPGSVQDPQRVCQLLSAYSELANLIFRHQSVRTERDTRLVIDAKALRMRLQARSSS